MGHDIRPLVAFIKSWEGGFVDDPDDKGGATNKGITIGTFRSVYGRNKTVEDLKRMTDQQWEYIFRTKYWNRWKADQIKDPSVAFFLVSWVWGSGVWGIKNPQKVLGVAVDGVVGALTLRAVNSRDGRELFEALKKEKRAYLERICISTPTNRKFLKGWLRRLDSFNYRAITLNTRPARTVRF